MKTEDFMDLLNEVDDKFIQELYEETEFSKPAKKTSRTSIVWTRWAGIAAAFALIILGSVLLGIMEIFVASFNSTLRDLFVYGLLIIVLIVRPSGLMGKVTEDKA